MNIEKLLTIISNSKDNSRSPMYDSTSKDTGIMPLSIRRVKLDAKTYRYTDYDDGGWSASKEDEPLDAGDPLNNDYNEECANGHDGSF